MSRSAPSYRRTVVLCGTIAGIAIGLNAVTVAVAERDREAVVRDARQVEALAEDAYALVRTIDAQAIALDDYLISGDATDLERYHDATATEDRISSTMRGSARTLPGVVAALDALAGATNAWRVTVSEAALRAPRDQSALSAGGVGAGSALREPIDGAASSLVRQLGWARDAVREREAELTAARGLTTAVEMAAGIAATLGALILIYRFGRSLARDARHAAVINRFTESTAFARDDAVVASSNLEALDLLAHPDAGVVHILNRSLDRAVPEASIGGAIAEVLPLKALGECPGMLRGNTHVVQDAGSALSVHCPVYPVEVGTLACVPLISGESVGAIHLYWKRTDGLALPMLADVNRLAQHAALAIANRRLLAALRGQASTDARTGLANSRAFDLALEGELEELLPGASLSVLMLDLDHFKDFNDRHGHPAGDEALRVFSGVLEACIRDNDLAARYGGEEFTVLLRGLGLADALVVAERIRQRTDSALIPLAPGITDRLTVSIGVACAPEHGMDRVALLRAADEALYQAKEAGRNRVAHPHRDDPLPVVPAAVA